MPSDGPGSLSWMLPRLREQFNAKYPDAAAVAAVDARGAVGLMGDIVLVETTQLPGTCGLDATYDPDPPTIRYRPAANRRDNFTLLHEIAHHLVAFDEDWCFDIAPGLGGDTARRVEELFANSFAADVLIDGETATSAFVSGVTSKSAVQLYEHTNASASACLSRCLREPGDRVVMLCDLDGRVWFAASTGTPFSPGRRTPQPAVAAAVERALVAPDSSHKLVGGEGIHYSSGKSYTAVALDVTVKGGLAFVVVTPTVESGHDVGTYEVGCAECFESFTQSDVTYCAVCRDHRCPHCRACGCQGAKQAICEGCYVVLPRAIAVAGRRLCEDCV